MLAGDAGAKWGAVEGQHRLIMPGDHLCKGLALRDVGRGGIEQVMGDLLQLPRAALRAAPDHNAIRAGQAQRIGGGFAVDDIAIGDDGNRDRPGDRADRRPIGRPFVELAARAPVDGDHANARRLGAPRQIGRIQQVVVPTQPGFQRDRHADRTHHRLDQRQRMIQIFHQRRPGIAADHLLGRAAHVDVDDPRALPFGQFRRFGHPMRFTSRQLHRCVFGSEPQFGPRPHTGLGLDHFLAGHHFRHHKPCPEARDKAAEWQIRDSCQRGQENRRIEGFLCQRNGQVINP